MRRRRLLVPLLALAYLAGCFPVGATYRTGPGELAPASPVAMQSLPPLTPSAYHPDFPPEIADA
jgi:hypothetical protein